MERRRRLVCSYGEGSAEHDALGEREFLRVVDGGSLAAHVGLPGVAAAFASAAGFLLAAKGAADFGAAGADVYIGDAAIAAAGREELLGLAQVVSENGRAEALGHFVVAGDGLVQGAIGDEVEDGGEGFVSDDLEIVFGGDETRADVTAAGVLGAFED